MNKPKRIVVAMGVLALAGALAAQEAGAQTTGVGVGGIPSGIGPGGSMSFTPGPTVAPSATLPGAGVDGGSAVPAQPRARGRGARGGRPAAQGR